MESVNYDSYLNPNIVFVFNDTICFKIDECVLKSFVSFRKFFALYKNEYVIINNIISSAEFHHSDYMYYSNIMHINYKMKTLIFEVPLKLFKDILYYALEHKSDYIKECLYFNIQLKFNDANLKQIFNYLGIPISFAYECERMIQENIELNFK